MVRLVILKNPTSPSALKIALGAGGVFFRPRFRGLLVLSAPPSTLTHSIFGN
ncbi:hypothetical protein ACFDR9_003062 [Janthinobacterium sp. CG_23.3]